MADRTEYRELAFSRGFWQMAALAAVFLAGMLGSVAYIEHHGHIVTGMTNQIVWGLPHVFAIFLIVAASGALNVASIASVFGRKTYKPLSRASGVVAISLLAGGLAVLVLDLGRPDRLIVAMTTYNFSSIFAWNVLLYTGFMGVVILYLFTQMARGVEEKWVKRAGLLAFLWRLALTTGTGSIFGWLVARPGYDAAVMAPLFIAMSFSFGLAFFILLMATLYQIDGRPLGEALLDRMGKLLALFCAVVLYFTAVQHLTNLYAAEHGGIEGFILRNGGLYTTLFWFGQVLIGGLIPMAMLYHPGVGGRRATVLLASALVVLGGFAQIYVIVIGGQAYPLETFPGYAVTSSFADGVVHPYAPTVWELLLGLGGVALTVALCLAAMKVLRILPTDLSDANVET